MSIRTAPADASVAPSPWRQARANSWYLVFLAIMLFSLLDPAAGAADLALILAVWAVFIPFYFLVEVRPGWHRENADVLTTLLAIAVMPLNPGGSVLCVYAASYAGSYRPKHVARRWFAGLTVLIVVVGLATATELGWLYLLLSFAPAALFVWIIGRTAVMDAERERESARLRVDNARIEHLATVNERERIARDLHDILGHTLTSVVVRSQLVQRLVSTDPGRAADEAAAIEEAARDALAQVRSTVHGWSQADLDQELVVARDALGAAGVTLDIDRDPGLKLAPSVEAALALSLREAVTNVVRHADARRCGIRIGLEAGEVTLRIEDDGRGGRTPDGGGLTGMRERIAALGGRVERRAERGTTITVAVPVEVAG